MKAKIALFMITLLSLALMLASCAPAPLPCPPHLDEDKNAVCDNCGEEYMPDDVAAAIAAIDLSGIRMNGKTVNYNGEVHSVECDGELPAGVSIVYENNDKTGAGSYTVVAKFYYHSETYNKDFYLEGKDKTASLEIKRASYDLSMLSMRGASVVYDGEMHSILVEGELPGGVEIAYSASGYSAVGTYNITASFVVDEANYIVPAPLSATLRIVEGPASLGGVMLRDKVVAFDGEKHSLEVEANGASLTGVEIDEIGNNVAYIGDNVVDITLTVGGESAKLTAHLTIEPSELVGTDGLVYAVSGNNRVEVVGYTGSATVVVIPEMHTIGSKEYTVYSIASGAFSQNDKIEYVVLSDNISLIGNNAFMGCTALKRAHLGRASAIGGLAFADTAIDEVVLPDTLSAIGMAAFRNTPMVKITLPFVGGSAHSSNPYLGYIFGAEGHAGNAAFVPETLTTVVISGKCKEIPAYAFRGCNSITSIILNEGVTKIGISAFEGTSITEIYIPISITSIPAAAYEYNSPFYNTSDELEIRLAAPSVPSGYGAMWNVVNEDEDRATVVLSATK